MGRALRNRPPGRVALETRVRRLEGRVLRVPRHQRRLRVAERQHQDERRRETQEREQDDLVPLHRTTTGILIADFAVVQ